MWVCLPEERRGGEPVAVLNGENLDGAECCWVWRALLSWTNFGARLRSRGRNSGARNEEPRLSSGKNRIRGEAVSPVSQHVGDRLSSFVPIFPNHAR
ncbi:hypothetical protein MTO96_030183 [Rhipicephalus appendiculatus]